MRSRSALVLLVGAIALAVPPSALAQDGEAPGSPGASANWTTGNKQGLGTSVSTRLEGLVHAVGRRVERGVLPARGHGATCGRWSSRSPTARRSSTARARTPSSRCGSSITRSLTYEQVNTAKSGRYRITKTYVTDPARGDGADAGALRAAAAGRLPAVRALRPGARQLLAGMTPRRGRQRRRRRAAHERGRTRASALVAVAGLRAHVERLRRHQRRLDRPRGGHDAGLRLRHGDGRQRPADRRDRRCARRTDDSSRSRSASAAPTRGGGADGARRASRGGFAGRAAAYRSEWHSYLGLAAAGSGGADRRGCAPSTTSR